MRRRGLLPLCILLVVSFGCLFPLCPHTPAHACFPHSIRPLDSKGMQGGSGERQVTRVERSRKRRSDQVERRTRLPRRPSAWLSLQQQQQHSSESQAVNSRFLSLSLSLIFLTRASAATVSGAAALARSSGTRRRPQAASMSRLVKLSFISSSERRLLLHLL